MISSLCNPPVCLDDHHPLYMMLFRIISMVACFIGASSYQILQSIAIIIRTHHMFLGVIRLYPIVSTTHPMISLCHSVRCHRFVTIRVWTMQSLIIVDAYVLMYCSMENTCFHPPTLPLWFCCAIHPPTYNLTHIICASRMLLLMESFHYYSSVVASYSLCRVEIRKCYNCLVIG